jgi:hypothetical protein
MKEGEKMNWKQKIMNWWNLELSLAEEISAIKWFIGILFVSCISMLVLAFNLSGVSNIGFLGWDSGITYPRWVNSLIILSFVIFAIGYAAPREGRYLNFLKEKLEKQQRQKP